METGAFSKEEDRQRTEDCESVKQIRILEKLETDRDLAELGRVLGEFDALAVLGVSRREEVHSNVLAWLLNPRENHSLGDFFLKRFLRETKAATAEQIRNEDWSQARVQREWRNEVDGDAGALDILVCNTNARFVCAIENKVLSSEHSGQLTRYRKALCRQFGCFERSHVFVTRDGTIPIRDEERRFWVSVDYGTILRLVDEAIKCEERPLPGEIVAFLSKYATTLRRRIVPDSDMKRMANSMYFRHREAIDLMLEQKEAHISALGKICSQAVGRYTSWATVGVRNGGKLVGFTEPSWRQFGAFNTGTGLSGNDPSDLLLLDFDFRRYGTVKLNLTIMAGTREDVRRSLYEMTQGRHPEVFDHGDDEKGGSYNTSTIRLYSSDPILSEGDFIDGDRSCWSMKVNDWLSDFARSKLLEMNGIILESLQRIDRERGSQPA